uniref:Peptidase M50 n=1 Tax=uncultured Chloroflexota bacterium TaxID=166587 RepID=H5SQ59_9CHLR|nr:peptidase M50 [uncultured Chloroflexota bacterium]
MEPELLTSIVSRHFFIQDVTLGDNLRWFARYRGRLLEESEKAYDALAEMLRLHGLMPLFRLEQGQHVVYIVPLQKPGDTGKPIVNLILFLLTLASVLFTSATMGNPYAPAPRNFWEALYQGWPFTLSLLAILLTHEFGHYLMSRYHRTAATLPYFIPLPLISPLGTMGAVIQMRQTPKNRRVLFDIGLAGPLAGFLVAIPILIWGLAHSDVRPLDFTNGMVLEGNSLFYLLLKYLIHREWLPTPSQQTNLWYWIRYFFTSSPLPLGGRDVLIHPVAFAGWAGLLVTSLNLIPAGTLDGGHILYAALGERARRLFPLIILLTFLLGFGWNGWWLWTVLLFWLGRTYAEPLDQITPLDRKRRLLAWLALIIFLAIFIPVPLVLYQG